MLRRCAVGLFHGNYSRISRGSRSRTAAAGAGAGGNAPQQTFCDVYGAAAASRSTGNTRYMSTKLADVPSLKDFLKASAAAVTKTDPKKPHHHAHAQTIAEPSIFPEPVDAAELTTTANLFPSLKFYVETYGCQMNVSDTEIVNSILSKSGHQQCDVLEEADLILANTCAIRENAEAKVWHRLAYFESIRKKNRKVRKSGYPLVGVLGCMAERLKDKLLESKSVDFVCGPDAYRDVPRLIKSVVSTDMKDSNTRLSLEETYADINPVRDSSTNSAFVSIMRGCNNMCSFCVVPFTRGRERSRPLSSVLEEVRTLAAQGVKEIVLLGQNVNGYHDTSTESIAEYPETTFQATPGFKNLFQGKIRQLPGARFADILTAVAAVDPDVRIRFTSPHPKDFPLDVLEVIANTHNICKSIHMPIQSGSTTALQRMRRGYTREAFFELVQRARVVIPGVTLSTDVIAGFCGETEEEHADTVSAMKAVGFDQAFMFAYSLREKTHAARTMVDDVSEDVKQRRLQEIIAAFREQIPEKNTATESNRYRLVLVEGPATKSTANNVLLTGRTDGNKRVVFPALNGVLPMRDTYDASSINEFDEFAAKAQANIAAEHNEPEDGDNSDSPVDTTEKVSQSAEEMTSKYVIVKIIKANGSTLRAIPVAYSNLLNFQKLEPLLGYK
jgi:MiaB/RimO family radical SAM methylthiotransferase